MVCRRCYVSGRVQGVFYRASTREQAERLGVTGHARNLPDGRVEVLACGEQTVAHVESLRPDMPIPLADGGHVKAYREILESDGEIVERTAGGPGQRGAVRAGRRTGSGALCYSLTGSLPAVPVSRLHRDVDFLRQGGCKDRILRGNAGFGFRVIQCVVQAAAFPALLRRADNQCSYLRQVA